MTHNQWISWARHHANLAISGERPSENDYRTLENVLVTWSGGWSAVMREQADAAATHGEDPHDGLAHHAAQDDQDDQLNFDDMEDPPERDAPNDAPERSPEPQDPQPQVNRPRAANPPRMTLIDFYLMTYEHVGEIANFMMRRGWVTAGHLYGTGGLLMNPDLHQDNGLWPLVQGFLQPEGSEAEEGSE